MMFSPGKRQPTITRTIRSREERRPNTTPLSWGSTTPTSTSSPIAEERPLTSESNVHLMEVIPEPESALRSPDMYGRISPVSSSSNVSVDIDEEVAGEDVDNVRTGTVVVPPPKPIRTQSMGGLLPSTPSVMMSPPSINTREVLGKGSFGLVYKAMNRETNEIFAMKEIVLVKDDASQIANVSREIRVMKQLDHENIVKYYGARRDGDRLYIHMEYIDGGSIATILKDFGPLHEKQAVMYCTQILTGLEYLHNMRVVHRDLKGENLLVDKKGRVKLADFGTSKELQTIAQTLAGTSHFMAPEVIRGTGHDFSADVWSVGCCVIQMLTGRPPFSNFEMYAAMTHICEHPSPWDATPASASEQCKDFVRQCMQPDPKKRATVSELLRHPWILSPPPTPAAAQPTDPRRRGQRVDTPGLDKFNPMSDE
eukprot:PhM_4_TR15186/c0_g1_i1/m.46554